MLKRAEILSPAGSMESLVAAVRAGADAVYLGMREMSARRNAENFDTEGLKAAVEYCRVRNVAVYLTLNIMLKENELSDALDIVRDAVLTGISGIIVQDIGLAHIIHTAFPRLPLHASTQMSVNSPSALSVLKELGFCRVVTAREMSRNELKTFCEKAKELEMEVEVFVHGALCMSMSGQCLMSAMLGGRSGNRGLCAGPCRLPFEVSDGTGFDLSLKDLSLLSHLKELEKMGVSSFKIEGRMKRPEYVAAATAAARTALYGGDTHEIFDTLQNVFSRSGFTDGYYTEQKGRDMFGIRTRDDVIAAGDAIPKLHELYRNERQSIPVSMEFKAQLNRPCELTLTCGLVSVTVSGTQPQTAANIPLDLKAAEESFKKLGSTQYYCEDFKAEIEENIFLKKADINELRRNGIEFLDKVRVLSEPLEEMPFEFSKDDIPHAKKPALIARFAKPEKIPNKLDGLTAVVVPIFENVPESLPQGITVIAELPRRIHDESALLKRLEYVKAKGIKTAICGNLAAVELAKSVEMSIVGDIGLNVCNSESISVLKEMGLSAVSLSAEIDMGDAVGIPSSLPKGIFAYGRLPLMLLENCPLKNGRGCEQCDKKGYITDRKAVNFPIRCTGGVSELLNSVPIWLADRLTEMGGLDFLYLRFDDESPDEAREIINAYISGGASSGEYTRGLYYREVL